MAEQIPEHHSGVQHIMNKVHGKSYTPLTTLEEAQGHDDAVVILEGDWGGIIYATCPVKHLRDGITHEEIVILCKKLERDFWGYGTDKVPAQVPPEGGWGVYYQRLESGRGVWGGMGGGKVIDGLWVHDKLKLADEVGQQIQQVLLNT